MKVRVHVDIEDVVISRVQELTKLQIKDFIEKVLNENYDEVVQFLTSIKFR